MLKLVLFDLGKAANLNFESMSMEFMVRTLNKSSYLQKTVSMCLSKPLLILKNTPQRHRISLQRSIAC
ncbi:MAG: hypothetical protein CM15mP59_6210 [Flavobacteriaceae bacterium]|nr:MAG: hypothetical protein CM15mP59_6210 [Flavobacteriaceae bacterium]